MEKSAEEKEELTMLNVPKAVNYLINEIAEMRVLLEHIEKQLGLGIDKHRPIGIADAARVLGETERAISKKVRSRSIPHYVQDKKVYFFEDELVKWVESSRVKTFAEEYQSRRRY